MTASGVGDEQGWWGLQDVTVDCVDRQTFRHWLRVWGMEKSKDYGRPWKQLSQDEEGFLEEVLSGLEFQRMGKSHQLERYGGKNQCCMEGGAYKELAEWSAGAI